MTNPWLPDRDNNKIIIHRNDEKLPVEIEVTAEKSLYTYQIDTMSRKILGNVLTYDEGMSWQDSIMGNITVLDMWLEQVKASV
jgi:hypothetical protein